MASEVSISGFLPWVKPKLDKEKRTCDLTYNESKSALRSRIVIHAEQAGFQTKDMGDDRLRIKNVSTVCNVKFVSIDGNKTAIRLEADTNFLEPLWLYPSAVGGLVFFLIDTMHKSMPGMLDYVACGVVCFFMLYQSIYKPYRMRADLDRLSKTFDNSCELPRLEQSANHSEL